MSGIPELGAAGRRGGEPNNRAPGNLQLCLELPDRTRDTRIPTPSEEYTELLLN
jgi:hypothetical protein